MEMTMTWPINMMQRIFEIYFKAVDGRRNTKGGEYHINLLPTTVHIYFGSVTGATPDGRLAHDTTFGRYLTGTRG